MVYGASSWEAVISTTFLGFSRGTLPQRAESAKLLKSPMRRATAPRRGCGGGLVLRCPMPTATAATKAAATAPAINQNDIFDGSMPLRPGVGPSSPFELLLTAASDDDELLLLPLLPPLPPLPPDDPLPSSPSRHLWPKGPGGHLPTVIGRILCVRKFLSD